VQACEWYNSDWLLLWLKKTDSVALMLSALKKLWVLTVDRSPLLPKMHILFLLRNWPHLGQLCYACGFPRLCELLWPSVDCAYRSQDQAMRALLLSPFLAVLR
jgi:hypothetical protein